jgi:hypothetical protein
MRCEVHCPQGGSAAGLVAAVLVAAAAAAVAVSVATVAWQVLGAVLPAVTGLILGACVAGAGVVRHLVLYGRARKPRPVRVPARPQLALEAPRRALEAAPRPGVPVTLTAADYVREGAHRVEWE